MIHLADLSCAQAPSSVDYGKMAASGIKGVYVRAGDGLHDSDPAMVAHLHGVTSAGMRAGVYHVLAPSSGHPELQAARLEAWHRGLAPGALPPVVDVERNRPLGADAPAWRACLEAYLAAAPCGPLVYTYQSFLLELQAAGFKAGRLWLARYPTIAYPDPKAEQLRKAVLAHMIEFNAKRAAGDPAGAAQEARSRAICAQQLSSMGLTPQPLGQAPQGAALWQWGGDANASTVAGARGLCDRSYYLGDDASFAAFA